MHQARKPDIMADAAYAIFNTPSRELTGQFLIDDRFLATRGVTDFDRYSVDPTQELAPDFFLPDDSVAAAERPHGRKLWRSPVTYRAPLADIGVALKYAAGTSRGDRRRTVRRPHHGRRRRSAGGSRPLRRRGARAAQSRRRQIRHAVQGRRCHHARPAGRRPITAGARAAGTVSPRRPNGAARPCRRSSTSACMEMWNSAAHGLLPRAAADHGGRSTRCMRMAARRSSAPI